MNDFSYFNQRFDFGSKAAQKRLEKSTTEHAEVARSHRLANEQCSLAQRFRLLVLAALAVEHSQVVQRGGDLREREEAVPIALSQPDSASRPDIPDPSPSALRAIDR